MCWWRYDESALLAWIVIRGIKFIKLMAHTTRKIPGTQETRRMMIFATQAYRIRYGTQVSLLFL